VTAFPFPFQGERPVVTLTLKTPDPRLQDPPQRKVTLLADTGFSDYLQLDWETFSGLGLENHTLGTLTSGLADGSTVIDLVAMVRVVIEECAIDTYMRCLSNPAYGGDLLLAGSSFLSECRAVIDFPRRETALSR